MITKKQIRAQAKKRKRDARDRANLAHKAARSTLPPVVHRGEAPDRFKTVVTRVARDVMLHLSGKRREVIDAVGAGMRWYSAAKTVFGQEMISRRMPSLAWGIHLEVAAKLPPWFMQFMPEYGIDINLPPSARHVRVDWSRLNVFEEGYMKRLYSPARPRYRHTNGGLYIPCFTLHAIQRLASCRDSTPSWPVFANECHVMIRDNEFSTWREGDAHGLVAWSTAAHWPLVADLVEQIEPSLQASSGGMARLRTSYLVARDPVGQFVPLVTALSPGMKPTPEYWKCIHGKPLKVRSQLMGRVGRMYGPAGGKVDADLVAMFHKHVPQLSRIVCRKGVDE